jgi:hypothetical protein
MLAYDLYMFRTRDVDKDVIVCLVNYFTIVIFFFFLLVKVLFHNTQTFINTIIIFL